MLSLKKSFLATLGEDANDMNIDLFVTALQKQRAHMLHTHLQRALEEGGAGHFEANTKAYQAVLDWLKTPRTIGELAVLSVALNEGLILFTRDGEEAEHFGIDVNSMLSQLVPTAKEGQAYDMTQFEKELDTIACSRGE